MYGYSTYDYNYSPYRYGNGYNNYRPEFNYNRDWCSDIYRCPPCYNPYGWCGYGRYNGWCRY